MLRRKERTMGSQKAKRHVHKYRLVPMNASQKVWSCALPDCNHYMPPNMAHMIEGKSSECWNCSKATTMTTERMQYSIANNEGRMLCQDCILRQQGLYIAPEEEVPSMDDIVADYIKTVKK